MPVSTPRGTPFLKRLSSWIWVFFLIGLCSSADIGRSERLLTIFLFSVSFGCFTRFSSFLANDSLLFSDNFPSHFCKFCSNVNRIMYSVSIFLHLLKKLLASVISICTMHLPFCLAIIHACGWLNSGLRYELTVPRWMMMKCLPSELQAKQSGLHEVLGNYWKM